MKVSIFRDILDFFGENWQKIMSQTFVHTGLTFISLILAVIFSIPLGIWLTRNQKWASFFIGFASLAQTIPSLALLGLTIPLLGIGFKPAILVLFIYALLPILRNTYTGILGVDSLVKESAMALGMTQKQILFQVEIPLAMPVIMAGIRIATVINVGVATLAAYIGAGGLGEFIFGGISLNNPAMMLGGAIPAALLAIFLDFLLSKSEKLNFQKSIIWISSVLILISLGGLYGLAKQNKNQLLAGFTPEFFGRLDGYKGLQLVYHLHINNVIISDAIMYSAIREGALDLISGYSTDGRIKAYNLFSLKDNLHVFPPYSAAPIMRIETLKQFPEISGILNLLAGKINDSVMTSLNYQVDILKRSPNKVAYDFLLKNGIYRPAQKTYGKKFILGSKIFGEQYILSSIYTYLLKGYSHLDVITKTGLGGTQVCFGALQNKAIDMYPEYTGTGLLVILKPDLHSPQKLKLEVSKFYEWVKYRFEKELGITWLKPIGFNNSYSLILRKEQAKKLHLTTISELKAFTNP